MRQLEGKRQLEFPVGKMLVPGQTFGPRFSPDGREIAFWKVEGGEGRLSVVDRLGKREEVLSAGWKTAEGAPCWAADGRELWFTGSRTRGTESLWALRRSGQLRQLVRIPGSLELYDVSKDGRALLAHHTITRVLRGLVPGQESEVDLAWLDSSRPADLSTDGTMVLITEDGEGAGDHPEIYLRTTDGAPAVRIAEGEAIALSNDKKWALARREEGGTRKLFVVPTGVGQARALGFEGLDVATGAFTPDGSRIAFEASAAGQPNRIYIVDAAGGEPRPVGPPGVSFQQWLSPISRDGRRAVGVRAGKLVVFSLDGSGEPRELPGLSSPKERPAQWSADSRSLYVYSHVNRGIKVELYDVETSERRPWKVIPIDESLTRFSVRLTPDGQGYVYGAWGIASALYLVEGLR